MRRFLVHRDSDTLHDHVNQPCSRAPWLLNPQVETLRGYGRRTVVPQHGSQALVAHCDASARRARYALTHAETFVVCPSNPR